MCRNANCCTSKLTSSSNRQTNPLVSANGARAGRRIAPQMSHECDTASDDGGQNQCRTADGPVEPLLESSLRLDFNVTLPRDQRSEAFCACGGGIGFRQRNGGRDGRIQRRDSGHARGPALHEPTASESGDR